MAYRYLKGPPGFAPEASLVEKFHFGSSGRYIEDRRGYCANSDLFAANDTPLGDKELSPEEYQRQAKIFRDFL